MLSHVLQCLPEEACGLIAASNQISQKVYPITNKLHSPVRFRMDAIEQLDAFQDMDEQQWELAAIYHSHPSGPPTPSPTDVEEFAYPGVSYLIWYPSGRSWAISGYCLSTTGYHPVDVHFIENV